MDFMKKVSTIYALKFSGTMTRVNVKLQSDVWIPLLFPLSGTIMGKTIIHWLYPITCYRVHRTSLYCPQPRGAEWMVCAITHSRPVLVLCCFTQRMALCLRLPVSVNRAFDTWWSGWFTLKPYFQLTYTNDYTINGNKCLTRNEIIQVPTTETLKEHKPSSSHHS